MTLPATGLVSSTVAELDVPGDQFGLGGAFAHVGQLEDETTHPDQPSMVRLIASATRSGPGKYSHSKACGYGMSQPHTRATGASKW